MRSRFAAAALFASAVPLLAQAPAGTPTPRPTPKPPTASLADVVKRANANREGKPKKKSLGVITNESLKSHEATAKPASHVDGKVSAPSAPAQPSDFVAKDNEGRTEQQWRERAASLRRNVADSRERVRKLEAETKRLENDFYAWSDGNYRDGVIKPSWDKAREDLKAARAELDSAETSLANLEDEARKAGAPPGWIR